MTLAPSGVKIDDLDASGDRTGDEGLLEGWPITLTGPGGLSLTTTTDANGEYSFEVDPGTYTITEGDRDGYRQSGPSSGTYTVTVQSDDNKRDRDFANVCLADLSVGVTDISTGQPVSDIEMVLEEISVGGVIDNDPALPRTTTNGEFSDLLAGTYQLTAYLPEGVYSTDPGLQFVDGRLAIVREIDLTACQTTDEEIEMFTLSSGKVTGGQVDVAGSEATSGFSFQSNKDGSAKGHLQFDNHEKQDRLKFNTKNIDAVLVYDNQAIVIGKVEIDGTSYGFILRLTDNGEPGRDDVYDLVIANGYTVGQGGTIRGGNIQIHK